MDSPFLNPFEPVETHRHRLPHWHQGEAWQFVTWRLADSLPAGKLNEWRREKEEWLRKHPEPLDLELEKEYHRLFPARIEGWLDQGHGCCALKERAVAAVVEGALRYFDGERLGLGPFVLMPNHVHVLLQPAEGHELKRIMHSLKSFTAHKVSKLLGTEGPFWQEEYWDRVVRSEKHWQAYRGYIERNPIHLRNGTFVLGCGTREKPV